jgi:tetratricopeptide (TPR) repeat protein
VVQGSGGKYSFGGAPELREQFTSSGVIPLRMKSSLVFVALMLLASCRHRVAVPLDVSLYLEGLNAFGKATPEGYQQSVDAFRKAGALNASRCEYSLHLAQSLLFLAAEQRLNWEPFLPLVADATAVAGAVESNSKCTTFTPFLWRVRALALSFQSRPGSNAEALTLINRALERDSRDGMSWIVLSQLSPDDARLPSLRALELSPDLALVQNAVGQYYQDSGRYSEAKNAFTRAVELSSRHFRSLLALAYLANLEYKTETETLYVKAVSAAPEFLNSRLLLGGFYSGIGAYEKASEQYRAAISANNRYYPALLGLGRAMIYADRTAEAVSPLQQVVSMTSMAAQMTPEDATALSDARYLLGHAAMARLDASGARAELEEALRAARNVDAMLALGGLYYREGEFNQALRQYESAIQFEKAMKVAHEFPDAYFYRGMIRVSQRQVPEAIDDFNHAIEVYERQIADLRARVEKSQSLSLALRARRERREIEDMEEQLRLAIESRDRARQE